MGLVTLMETSPQAFNSFGGSQDVHPDTMAEQNMYHKTRNDVPRNNFNLFLVFLEFRFKIMFFSTVSLTLEIQNGGKIEFYSWTGLKQRRGELILKGRNEAGSAIPSPVFCETCSLQK